MLTRYLGIDINQHRFELTWLCDLKENKLRTKIFPNSDKGIDDLWDWSAASTRALPWDCVFVLDATSDYELIAHTLYSKGAVIRIVQPWYCQFSAANTFIGRPLGQRSILLARHGAEGMGRTWQPAKKPTCDLKDFYIRCSTLEQDIKREESRLATAKTSSAPQPIITSIAYVVAVLNNEKKFLEAIVSEHTADDHRCQRERKS